MRTTALRVVVVDDLPEIREIVSMLLDGDPGFRVVAQAGDGQSAITVVGQEQPDVVLLDLEMPGMSGWDALGPIREAAPGAAVVLFSGSISPSVRARAVERGAAGALDKGVDASNLVAGIRSILGSPASRAATGTSETPRVDAAGLAEVDELAVARLHALMGLTPNAVITAGLDGTILTWNPAAEEIYGYRADEVIGVPISVLAPPDEEEQLHLVLHEAAAGLTVQREVVHRRKDRSFVGVGVRLAPIWDRKGDLAAVCVFANDLGERQRRERALARAVAQLERQNAELLRSNEELDRFAYVASHDLAQPLQVIYGYLELLQTEYGETLETTAQEWLGQAVTSVERMRILVRDLLAYARLGSSSAPLRAVDATDAVRDAQAALAVLVRDRQAKVHVDDLPVVEGDRVQLGQLFQNLIGNALKFTSESRIPEVRVAAERLGRFVRFSVSDNGPGISVESRSKVFEMFERTSESKGGGSGLGLAISKRIVERHGGEIWIDSSPGGGTTVAFTLRSAG